MGALNHHLQPEAADTVQRSEANNEAEERAIGIAEDDGPSGSPQDMGRFAGGPQPEPRFELGETVIRPKVPDILQVPKGFKHAEPAPSQASRKPTVQLHLYYFQVEPLVSPCRALPGCELPAGHRGKCA